MPKIPVTATPLEMLLQPLLVDELRRLRALGYNAEKRNSELARIATARVLQGARCTPAELIRAAGLDHWIAPAAE